MTGSDKPALYEPKTDVWEEAAQAFDEDSKARKTITYHKARTHNCAQAVLCSFADELGMDEEDPVPVVRGPERGHCREQASVRCAAGCRSGHQLLLERS